MYSREVIVAGVGGASSMWRKGARGRRALITLWRLDMCLEFEIHHISSLMGRRFSENSGAVCKFTL